MRTGTVSTVLLRTTPSLVISTPTPVGFNAAAAGFGDAEINRLFNAGLQNPGKGGCKYFSIVQRRSLENFYSLPMAFRSFDLFARNVPDCRAEVNSISVANAP